MLTVNSNKTTLFCRPVNSTISRTDTNNFLVVGTSVHTTHDTLVISFEEDGNSCKDIDGEEDSLR